MISTKSNLRGFSAIALVAIIGFLTVLTLLIGANFSKKAEVSNDLLTEKEVLGEQEENNDKQKEESLDNTQPLMTPQNLRLNKIECKEQGLPLINLAWDKVEGANYYRLFIKNNIGKVIKDKLLQETNFLTEYFFETDIAVYIQALRKEKVGEEHKIIADSDASKELNLKKENIKKECPQSFPPEKKKDFKELIKIATHESKLEVKPDAKVEKKKKEESMILLKEEKNAGKLVASESGQAKDFSKLEQRVKQLESELEKTQQKQSALVEMVENLFRSIKNLFKF